MKSTRRTESRQRTVAAKPARKTLRIDQISLMGDTQPRAKLDQEVIEEYRDLYERGVELPPIVVFTDGAQYWLVDGFHRRWAAYNAHLTKINCLVYEGTLTDARWASYSVNQTHGLRRTTADKQKAIEAALLHPVGAGLSDSQIADHLGVDHKTVGKYRADLGNSQVIRKGRDGRVINTSSIGKSAKPVDVQPDQPVDVQPDQDNAQYPPCPNCGNRTRNEDGDCDKCLDPCENEGDAEPEYGPGHPLDADSLIATHSQPWDRWGDWRVVVGNVAKCCKLIDAAVVAELLEDLAADIRDRVDGGADDAA